MVSLMQRRREMMRLASTPPTPPPTPTLIYELASAVSTTNYDTNVKLFDPAISFTILLEATYKNYNWTGDTQAIFRINSGLTFRFGRMQGIHETANNTPASTTSALYTGVAFNNSNDAVPKKAASLKARQNATITKRYAFRFDLSTLRFEGNNDGSQLAPSASWWNISSAISSSDTIKLNVGTGTSCTVNIFKVYNGVLTDAEVNAFIQGT